MRMLRTGLSHLPDSGDDEESKRPGSPAEDIVQLDHDDPRAIEFRNRLRTWFRKPPWSSVRLHEVRQWLYWSIFNKNMPSLDELTHPQRVVMDDAIALIEKRTGSKIEEGSNPTAPPMRLTVDDVNILWHPLCYYVAIWFINSCLKRWYESRWNARFRSYHMLE